MEANTQVKVRLYTYKWFRHYGGREISTESHICNASFIKAQIDHTFVVKLEDDCAGHKKGSMIAVLEKDFNI